MLFRSDTTTLMTKLAGLFAGGVALAPMAPAAITACLANITLCGIQAAELASGSALGPMGIGVGNMALRAGVKGQLTAEQANAQWLAVKPGNTSAWTEGTAVFQGEISAGTIVRMYVNAEQAANIAAGRLTQGLEGWATFDNAAVSVNQMRNTMGLTEGFKATSTGPFYVVELQVTRPMPANIGFVGPQFGNSAGDGIHALEPAKYGGGGTQIQLTDYFNRDYYLRVVKPPKCVGVC